MIGHTFGRKHMAEQKPRRTFKTRGPLGEVQEWEECTLEEWDRAGDSAEILKGRDKETIFVRSRLTRPDSHGTI